MGLQSVLGSQAAYHWLLGVDACIIFYSVCVRKQPVDLATCEKLYIAGIPRCCTPFHGTEFPCKNTHVNWFYRCLIGTFWQCLGNFLSENDCYTSKVQYLRPWEIWKWNISWFWGHLSEMRSREVTFSWNKRSEGLLFRMISIHSFTFRAIFLFFFSQYFYFFFNTYSVWQQIGVSDPMDCWSALTTEYIMVPGGRWWIDRLKVLKKINTIQ